MVNNFCVYIHFKVTNDKPFYVGKGLPKRPYWPHGRSKQWNRTAKKHGLRVFVAAHDLLEAEAFALERCLIERIGLPNLCNHTSGGEGCSNPSSETRKKMSLAKKGHKKSPETIAKHAAKMRGRKMPPEAVEKTRLAHIGTKRTEESRLRMSASHGDPVMYSLSHKNGGNFSGTRRDMARFLGISSSEAYGLVKGHRRTARGWRIS